MFLTCTSVLLFNLYGQPTSGLTKGFLLLLEKPQMVGRTEREREKKNVWISKDTYQKAIVITREIGPWHFKGKAWVGI